MIAEFLTSLKGEVQEEATLRSVEEWIPPDHNIKEESTLRVEINDGM